MLRNMSHFGKRWVQAGATMLLVFAASIFVSSPGLVYAKSNSVNQFSTGQATTIAQSDMPAQGRDMLQLVYRGGPFRYDKDGTVFGNRERILPSQSRGYYREYTVKTPSERTRGAKRIICGGTQPTAPDACYYTDDHYASFRKIVQ